MPSVVKTLKTARCGVLIVPENRAEKNSRKIRLAVAILPAKSATPASDPIVYRHGGPGGDVFDLANELVDIAHVNRDRDVILMSQRGTKNSSVDLSCLSIDEFAAQVVSVGQESPEATRLRTNAARQCLRESRAKADLSQYNTTQVAADVEDLRKALGIRVWNVFGHSYGTYEALTYMRQYPDGIRSVVLDGVVPTDIATLGIAWRGAPAVVDDMSYWCQRQPDCAKRYPNINKSFEQLLIQTAKKPIVTTIKTEMGKPLKVVIDPPALLSWLVTGSHLPATAAMVIGELARGDPKPLAEQWALTRINPDGFGHLAWGLFDNMVCSEWAPNAAEVAREGRGAFPNVPAKVWSEVPQVQWQVSVDCKVWGGANTPSKAPASLRQLPHNNIPTLVMNGTYDVQTAASNGAHVARNIPNAINVSIVGAAHATFVGAAGSGCAAQVITSFFDHPNVPDTSCAPKTTPDKFEVRCNPTDTRCVEGKKPPTVDTETL